MAALRKEEVEEPHLLGFLQFGFQFYRVHSCCFFQHVVVCVRELMLYVIWFHWMRRCDGACVGRLLISCREKSRG